MSEKKKESEEVGQLGDLWGHTMSAFCPSHQHRPCEAAEGLYCADIQRGSSVCGGGGGGYSLVARPTLWSIAGSQPINVRPHWPRLPVQRSGSQSYTFEFHVFPRGRTTSIPILSRWLWRISMESGIKWISFDKWISKCYMCFSWAVYR